MLKLVATILMLTGTFSAPDDSTAPKVLFVSDAVQQCETLASAANDDVVVIKYEAKTTDVNQLLNLAKKSLGDRKASSIGIAAHDYGEAKFYLTGKTTVSLASTLNDQSQRRFWKELGALIQKDGRIDIFACNLARSDQGKILISSLEEISGVTVAASENETGNVKDNGDWILERNGLDVSKTYFSAIGLEKFTGLLWAVNKKLQAHDPAEYHEYGTAVAINNDYAVIGAQGDSGYTGEVYIYYRNEGGADNWGFTKKILPSDPKGFSYFGNTVSLSGDMLIVTAYMADGAQPGSGAAYLFSRNEGGNDNWGQVAKLQADDGASGRSFGSASAISGDTVVVGAKNDVVGGFQNAGSAYIFSRNQGGANTWGQVSKINASDASSDSLFGDKVAISGEHVAVGALNNDQMGNDAGAVYLFSQNQGGPDNWGFVKQLTAPDAMGGERFGNSVSMYGDELLVGARGYRVESVQAGAAFLYLRNSGGSNNWGHTKTLSASDAAADDYFGQSVTIYNDDIIVGANLDDDNGIDSGSAYMFARNRGGAGNWGQVDKLVSSDGIAGDYYGRHTSLSPDYAIIGVPLAYANKTNNGSAYIIGKTHTVEVQAVAGGATDKDGYNNVVPGGSISILATPSPGYLFSSWSGDASGSANPLNLTSVSGDMTITPVFTAIPGTLNVLIAAGDSGGSYTISGPAGFNSGTPLSGKTTEFSQSVPNGIYKIEFAEVAGYAISIVATSFTITSNQAEGSLMANQTEIVSAVYGNPYDINKDGVVTPGDALIVLQHYLGSQPITDPVSLTRADVNRDGSITPGDALLVLKEYLGINI